MQHRRIMRRGGAFAALALILIWAPRVHAFGCQASGSLPIFPSTGTSCPIGLAIGDFIDIQINVNNTSSSVPPAAIVNVSAKIVNVCIGGANNSAACTVAGDCDSLICGAAVSYTFACTDTTCALELPGTLTFVPVGATGCVSNVPGVTSCALDPQDVTGNTVSITVNAAGVPLPPGASVAVATIRAQATAQIVANVCGKFGTRADTTGNSIVTTDGQCDATATGGASGSTNLFLPPPTPTPTPTPTTTATPRDHFQCYEIHRPPTNEIDVSLIDQFGSATADVKTAKRLCAPANKNGEDPDAPTNPRHLTAYTIKQTTGFAPIKNVLVTDQFGSLLMTVTKPDRLLVPTAKSLVGPPGPLQVPLDHYKCYRVAHARFRRAGITAETQFGESLVDIKKPMHLCTPVNKDGEDPTAPGHTNHLMCYLLRAKRPPLQPTVFTHNQFDDDTYPIFGPRELCVPATKELDDVGG